MNTHGYLVDRLCSQRVSVKHKMDPLPNWPFNIRNLGKHDVDLLGLFFGNLSSFFKLVITLKKCKLPSH